MNIPPKDSSLKRTISYCEMASYKQLENTENGIVQELEKGDNLLYDMKMPVCWEGGTGN